MRRLTALTLVASMASVSAAWAAPNCSGLVGTAITPDNPVAAVTNLSGDVKRSVMGGYVPIKLATQLYVNDSLLLGANGSAVITLGEGCQEALPANSFVDVVEQNGLARIQITLIPAAYTSAVDPAPFPSMVGGPSGLDGGDAGAGASGGPGVQVAAAGDTGTGGDTGGADDTGDTGGDTGAGTGGTGGGTGGAGGDGGLGAGLVIAGLAAGVVALLVYGTSQTETPASP